VQAMLTVVTQNSRLPRRSAYLRSGKTGRYLSNGLLPGRFGYLAICLGRVAREKHLVPLDRSSYNLIAIRRRK